MYLTIRKHICSNQRRNNFYKEWEGKNSKRNKKKIFICTQEGPYDARNIDSTDTAGRRDNQELNYFKWYH